MVTANAYCFIEAVDDPHSEWCDEHLLPCRLVQHVAVWYTLTPEGPGVDVAPHGIVRLEAHEG